MPTAARLVPKFSVLRRLIVCGLVVTALRLTSTRGEDQRPSEKSFPAGSGKFEVDVEGTRFAIFSYKPSNYQDGPLILVFHGVNRNADDYRDNAITLADRTGALIAAPLFDSERFPSRLYQ